MGMNSIMLEGKIDRDKGFILRADGGKLFWLVSKKDGKEEAQVIVRMGAELQKTGIDQELWVMGDVPIIVAGRLKTGAEMGWHGLYIQAEHIEKSRPPKEQKAGLEIG